MLAVATVSQTSIAFVGQGVGAIAPVLQQNFNLNNAQVGIAVSANNLGMGLTALFFGSLVDRYGDRRVMVAGGVLVGLTVLAATRMSVFGWFLALLIVTGMWSGSATPSGSKAIFQSFAPNIRGTAMGIRQMGVAAGGFIAALVLPVIAGGSHWARALAFAGAVTVVTNLVVGVIYKSSPSDGTTAASPRAGRNSGAAAALSRLWRATTAAGRTTAAGATSRPQANMRCFRQVLWPLRQKEIWYASIGGTTLVGSQFIIIGYSQLFLHKTAGVSLHYTFYFLAVAQFFGMSGRVLLGTISDRFFASKRKPMLLIASGTIVVLSFCMLLVSPSTPWWLVGAMFAVLGFVAMGWNGLWVTLVSELVDASQSSSALGAAMSLLQAGVFIYPFVFGTLVDILHSYSVSWMFMGCSVIGGMFLFTRLREGKSET